MSDKPETQDESKGVVRKRAPSFDEIMQGVSEEKSAPPPAAKKQPEPKKSAQPTFEEILERARPSSEPSRSPPPERKSRPPRQKDERKMPIVVRKPTLGSQPPAAPPAEATGAGLPATGSEAPTTTPPPAESVFAQPTAEENVDFAAMFAETEQQKPGRLKAGQKITARIAHLGGEVAFLDLGGKGEGIIDLRELRNDKGDLIAHV